MLPTVTKCDILTLKKPGYIHSRRLDNTVKLRKRRGREEKEDFGEPVRWLKFGDVFLQQMSHITA